jgi:drug/metabolite transporter (DMT)-like permease
VTSAFFSKRAEYKGLLLAFVGVAIFAGTLPMTRLGVQWLDPVFLTAFRSTLAGILAGAVLLMTRTHLPPHADWPKYALVAVCLVIGFPLCVGWAMNTGESSHGAVVMGILPLMTALMGALLLRDRPSAGFWVAAFLGAIVVIAFSLRKGGGGLETTDLAILGAVGFASVGYAVSAQLTQRSSGWIVISWAALIALPLNITLMLLLHPPLQTLQNLPLPLWISLGYLALMSQYIGFFAWNAGLARAGVARASQMQLLQPFLTLGVSAIVLREIIEPVTGLAAILVVCIVFLGRLADQRHRIRLQAAKCTPVTR